MFIRLTEIYFCKNPKGVYARGDVVLDIADVRKLTKIRDTSGEYCSRISFKGLASKEDIFVRETPEDIRDICLGYKEMLAVGKQPLSTNRNLQIEEPKPVTKKSANVTPLREFDDIFKTNANDVFEYDDIVKAKSR